MACRAIGQDTLSWKGLWKADGAVEAPVGGPVTTTLVIVASTTNVPTQYFVSSRIAKEILALFDDQ